MRTACLLICDQLPFHTDLPPQPKAWHDWQETGPPWWRYDALSTLHGPPEGTVRGDTCDKYTLQMWTMQIVSRLWLYRIFRSDSSSWKNPPKNRYHDLDASHTLNLAERKISTIEFWLKTLMFLRGRVMFDHRNLISSSLSPSILGMDG